MPHKTSVKRRTNFTMVENEVIDDESVSSSEKLVYMALSRFANYDSGKSWPSIDSLCKKSSLTRRTVISAIHKLEETSYLLVERSNNKPHTYWIGTGANEHYRGAMIARGGANGSHERDLENETNEQEVVEEQNGYHTTRSFTDTWQGAGGGRLSPHDYKRFKDGLMKEYSAEDLDSYVGRYFSKKYWFNKDGLFSFGPFYTHLGTIMSDGKKDVPKVRDKCPSCDSSAMQMLSGMKARCLSCNNLYERQAS